MNPVSPLISTCLPRVRGKTVMNTTSSLSMYIFFFHQGLLETHVFQVGHACFGLPLIKNCMLSREMGTRRMYLLLNTITLKWNNQYKGFSLRLTKTKML